MVPYFLNLNNVNGTLFSELSPLDLKNFLGRGAAAWLSPINR